MNISDDDVRAYVDGELAPEPLARIEAAIAADVLVAARVERERALRTRQRGSLHRATDEPQRASGTLDRDTNAVSGDARPRAEQPATATRWRRPLIALAAVVAALAIAGRWRTPSGDVAMRDGMPIARGELADRLDTALTSPPDATSNVVIGLAFRDREGRICRSFIAGSSRMAGVACHDGEAWTLQMLSRVDAHDANLFRTASAMPADVQVAVDARMQGAAFDDALERRARDAGWR